MDEVTKRNIYALKDYGEETRKLFRELEKKVNTINTLNTKILMLEQQVRNLQVKVHTGHSTTQ